MEEIVAFLISLIRRYGGIGDLLALAFEYLGLPMPGEPLMLLSGFLSRSLLMAVVTVIFAAAGTFCGSMIAYFIGFKFGQKVVLKIGRPFHLTMRNLDATRAALEKHEALYLIFSRFVPGVRHIIPYLTGISKMHCGRVILYNAISSAVWCSSFIFTGHILGAKWRIFERYLSAYSILILMALVFIFLLYKLKGRYRYLVCGTSVPLIAFTAMVLRQAGKGFHIFDKAVYLWMIHSFSKSTACLMQALSVLNSPLALGIITVLLLFVLWSTELLNAKMIFLDFVLSVLINIAGILVFTPGHNLPDAIRIGLSFSGTHSTAGLCFYGFLIYLCMKHKRGSWKGLIIPLLFLIIVMGNFGTVLMGMSNASDVLAGFAIGLSYLAAFIFLSIRLSRGKGGILEN